MISHPQQNPAVKQISLYAQAIGKELSDVEKASGLEPLHRMRIGSRRLRASLKVFKKLFPKSLLKNWQVVLRTLGRSLGKARELDTQIYFLNSSLFSTSDPELRYGKEKLTRILGKNRNTAQKEIGIILNKIKNNQDLFAPACFAENIQHLPLPSAAEIKKCLKKRIRAIYIFNKEIFDPYKIQELHQTRIAVKKLRYTIEVINDTYRKKFSRYISSAKAVQDLLGDIHELDVWLLMLPGICKADNKDKRLIRTCNFIAKKCFKQRKNKFRKFISLWKTQKKRKIWDSLLREAS
ncbi:MAG: CHAD domain-containing protein [Candidatus Omnitrophica bacterium]|nr:CHAD domain-containing protein [Candidatus Omnitrophota bacterium]